MAVINTNLVCDLQNAVKVQYLDGNIFSQDNQGNVINVTVLDGGEPATLSGTISANIIRADGGTVAATGGTITDNVASITLPAAAYAIPGVVSIVIKNTVSSVVTTIAAIVANVYQSSTDTVVDPGTIIPSVQTLISAIETAVASIPADYSSLWTSLAPAFSSSANYVTGQYVTYNGGLYRFTTAHSGEWSSSDVVATNLGGDVSDLKSALYQNITYKNTSFSSDIFPLRKGYLVNSLGRYGIDSNWVSGLTSDNCIYVYQGTKITANTGYKFSYSLWDVPITGSVSTSHNLELQRNIAAGTTITISQDGYLGFSCAYSDEAALPANKTAYEFANDAVLVELYVRTVKRELSETNERVESIGNNVFEIGNPSPMPTYKLGNVSGTGAITSHKNAVLSSIFKVIKGDYITCDAGYYISADLYTEPKAISANFDKEFPMTNSGRIDFDKDGYAVALISDSTHYNNYTSVLPNTDYQYNLHYFVSSTAFDIANDIENQIIHNRTISNKSLLFEAQKAIASDWHIPFVDMYDEMALGNNHQIPGTATIWSVGGTKDLTQKYIWMSDGVHPFRGVGLTEMYGRTIANRIAAISPSYHDGEGESVPSYWAEKKFLWMGTSIPAGSDPDAGSGTGATYPQLVAQQLGGTVTNIAKGSSMIRIGASTGEWDGIPFSHFLRAVTRMVSEVDAIASNWNNIYNDIAGAPSQLTESHINTMKNHSFENLLVPYLDGTNIVPDVIVIDYGTNDYADGKDGKFDYWVEPTVQNIVDGILAEDTYMTANNYANLKLALNNDLSGISDMKQFSASLNRNCFQGAYNFLVTLILRYKPYMRIIAISDYDA